MLLGFKRAVRRLLINRWFCRFLPERVAAGLENMVYLARTSRWINERGQLPIFADRYALYEAVLNTDGVVEPIDYLEFGVSTGQSFLWWSDRLEHAETRLTGFDTFEGLPEDWGADPKGSYSAGGRTPAVEDKRAKFEVGLFRDRLPDWLADHTRNHRMVIHLDADLYSSTLFVLTTLSQHLRAGDVLLFDEFASVRNAAHEFRAFVDFLKAYPMRYETIGTTMALKQVAIILND